MSRNRPRPSKQRPGGAWFRAFVLLHQLIKRRYIGNLGIALPRRLDHDADDAFFVPRNKRFPGKKGRDGDSAAMHFAALHGEILLGAAWISRDDLKPQTNSFFEELGNVMPIGAHPRGRASG